MPNLVFSRRFAEDLAIMTSSKVEERILKALDNIEAFAELGSKAIPESIVQEFGEDVRRVAVNPFDLIYTFDRTADEARIEALIPQRAVR